MQTPGRLAPGWGTVGLLKAWGPLWGTLASAPSGPQCPHLSNVASTLNYSQLYPGVRLAAGGEGLCKQRGARLAGGWEGHSIREGTQPSQSLRRMTF